jgi:hypothetical protein
MISAMWFMRHVCAVIVAAIACTTAIPELPGAAR